MAPSLQTFLLQLPTPMLPVSVKSPTGEVKYKRIRLAFLSFSIN